MKINKKLVYGAILAVVAAIAVIGWIMVKGGTGVQGKYDDFAKCLTEKEAKLYTTYWCPHCTEQKELFGSSLKYVDVTECDQEGKNAEPEKCKAADVTSIPAWIFADGSKEVGVHALEQLAKTTECTLPQE